MDRNNHNSSLFHSHPFTYIHLFTIRHSEETSCVYIVVVVIVVVVVVVVGGGGGFLYQSCR